jgi:hypothetical protein
VREKLLVKFDLTLPYSGAITAKAAAANVAGGPAAYCLRWGAERHEGAKTLLLGFT